MTRRKAEPREGKQSEKWKRHFFDSVERKEVKSGYRTCYTINNAHTWTDRRRKEENNWIINCSEVE